MGNREEREIILFRLLRKEGAIGNRERYKKN